MLDKKNFYINGEWVSPKKSNDFKVIDPSTEEECAVISLGGVEDVNDAVSAATKAFETWAFSTKEERLKYLEALYDVYKKRWADMAEAISLEMGAPIDFSTQLQAGTGASHIKSYIKVLKEYTFEAKLGEHALNNNILHEPKGVCALITPWNWPMNQVCLKVIPDVSGSDVPALAQLTTVTFAANALIGADGKAEVYGGSGSMNMNDHSDLQLPINEVTGCVYCRFNADLPYGSVLKTFTEKDFK